MFRRALVAKRYPPASYSNGVYQPGTPTLINCLASVQPMDGRDTLLLPEGRRNASRFVLYSDTLLSAPSQNTGGTGDRVTIDGRDYEVLNRQDWNNGLIPHYRYLVAEVQA